MTIKVAFQGALGANSEMAAQRFFTKQQIDCLPLSRFDQVFLQVKRGQADFGMIPIENTLTGSIHDNYDLLMKQNVWIMGEYIHRVNHHLMALPKAQIQDIRKVLSHPQALLQCAMTLKKLRKATPVPFFDTAGAAEFVASEKDLTLAAIASKEAAQAHGLKILQSGIEDHGQNYTRFLVITANPPALSRRGHYKTSIIFSLKSIPGALHKSLSVFALRDIDLLKIESRPLMGKPWEYIFYLDFAGRHTDKACVKALDHLSELTKGLRILGSYPSGLSPTKT